MNQICRDLLALALVILLGLAAGLFFVLAIYSAMHWYSAIDRASVLALGLMSCALLYAAGQVIHFWEADRDHRRGVRRNKYKLN